MAERDLASGEIRGFDLASIPVRHRREAEGRPSSTPPVAISKPGDAAEREADDAADRVMAGESLRVAAAATPGSARSCLDCEDDERQPRAQLRLKPFGEAAHARHAPPMVAAALDSPGRPLDGAVRTDFEPRFGTSFAHVRIHNDSAAAAAARSIGARAFTLGRRIGFASGQYEPGSRSGRRLLAHELAHVVQHRGATDGAILYRFPYETGGVSLPRQSIINLTGASYWERRTTDRYALTWDNRLANDPEERDAVLAALWAQNPPATFTAPLELVVPVHGRPKPGGGAALPALLYRFRFTPPVKPGERPALFAEFLAAGPGAVPVAAPMPPPNFKPGGLDGMLTGYAAGKAAFVASYPQEIAQLQAFLSQTSGGVDQVVKTATIAGTVTTHRSVFHVIRTTAQSGEPVLDLTLLSESEPAEAVAPEADYRDRDVGDFLLEQLRGATVPEADRLGAVKLPASLAADERLAVNLAVRGYFLHGKKRNTEVDAKVPVGTGSRIVLFTLRFGVGNDVGVERIGELGVGPGQIDMARLDVTRVNGFPGAAASDSTLRNWWKSRYPGGGALKTPAPTNPPKDSPAAETGPVGAGNAALIGEMNSLMVAGSGKASWFKLNYNIIVLTASAAKNRLINVHGVPEKLAAGTDIFPPAELAAIENALQTLAKPELAVLRGIRIGRKHGSISSKIVGKKRVWKAGKVTQYGITIPENDGSRTIFYFDSLTDSDDVLFRGSAAATVLPPSAMNILHEVGHVTEMKPGTESAFDDWIKKNPQTAPTWYSAQDPDSELFPEAYGLFHTDPHFLCTTAPLLYAWFATLARTRAPPAAGAKLVAPANCPP